MRKTKYNARAVYLLGMRFDSKKESERYLFLRDAESRGEISNLRTQVAFNLIPTKIKYIADFVYNVDGVQVIEDVKASPKVLTDVYRLKRELMRALLGLQITEIYEPTAAIR